MLTQLAKRMLIEVDPRLLVSFGWNFGWKGLRAVQRFDRRVRRGDVFPAFLFISVTNACNLACQGCWVTGPRTPRDMDPAQLDHIVREAKKQGCFFFGILGGEPLLHTGLLPFFGNHPDCYFQMFTNGTLLTDETARQLRRLGNVTPLISIEGLAEVSDERRRGTDVYERARRGLEFCRRHRLVTGVATSVCQSNLREVATDEFARDLVEAGVHYLWYYIYRPVGADPVPALALTPDQVVELRQFIVGLRARVPLAIVDAYWDHEGRALCPAATGISHHINPWGDVEPCPVVQFAQENINDREDLQALLTESRFLAGFRRLAANTTRGCIIMERPDLLRQFVTDCGARDSSGRGTAIEELAGMECRGSHHTPGREIPEKQWLYRFAKKHWFFGFGAYG